MDSALALGFPLGFIPVLPTSSPTVGASCSLSNSDSGMGYASSNTRAIGSASISISLGFSAMLPKASSWAGVPFFSDFMVSTGIFALWESPLGSGPSFFILSTEIWSPGLGIPSFSTHGGSFAITVFGFLLNVCVFLLCAAWGDFSVSFVCSSRLRFSMVLDFYLRGVGSLFKYSYHRVVAFPGFSIRSHVYRLVLRFYLRYATG